MSRTIPIYIFIFIQMSLARAWNSGLYSRSTGSTFRTYSGSPGGQFFISAQPYLKVMPTVEFLPAFGTIDDITAGSHEVDERCNMDQEMDENEFEKEESNVEELVIDPQEELAGIYENGDYNIPIDTKSSENTDPEI
ncbi:uncharacterized protein LOC133319791 [Danaus plexippus]|uniref:uncharacterized protein LOC133319791 n=1 Tax=Danaus plexippus TaxID=13037 RepID=UPI002AB2A585|nr:uncharacterized protein LOC133319791 [Danaus plexippus]